MMRRTYAKPRRFLLSSFAIGAVCAFAAAGFLDFHYFDREVESREAKAQRIYRDTLGQFREHFNDELFAEVKAARERTEADADRMVRVARGEVKSALELAEARRKLLEGKDREIAVLNAKWTMAESLLPRKYRRGDEGTSPEERNGEAAGDTSHSAAGDGQPTVITASRKPESWELYERRTEFARQIAAEAKAKTKPKGPIYLNTPRGRVILAPAEVPVTTAAASTEKS
jgi:hypothetical protein